MVVNPSARVIHLYAASVPNPLMPPYMLKRLPPKKLDSLSWLFPIPFSLCAAPRLCPQVSPRFPSASASAV